MYTATFAQAVNEGTCTISDQLAPEEILLTWNPWGIAILDCCKARLR